MDSLPMFRGHCSISLRLSDMKRPRQGFDFYSIVKAFLHSLPQPVSRDGSVTDRFGAVADEFEGLGARSIPDFEATVRKLLSDEIRRTKERLETRLRDVPNACKSWKDDLEHCLREYWS